MLLKFADLIETVSILFAIAILNYLQQVVPTYFILAFYNSNRCSSCYERNKTKCPLYTYIITFRLWSLSGARERFFQVRNSTIYVMVNSVSSASPPHPNFITSFRLITSVHRPRYYGIISNIDQHHGAHDHVYVLFTLCARFWRAREYSKIQEVYHNHTNGRISRRIITNHYRCACLRLVRAIPYFYYRYNSVYWWCTPRKFYFPTAKYRMHTRISSFLMYF